MKSADFSRRVFPRIWRLWHSVWALVLGLLQGGCATGPTAASPRPLTTVGHVDIKRYMGDWYVIANIPYFAEKGCVGSIESYALRADGRIDNAFTYHKQRFEAPRKRITALATIKNRQTNAEWRVRFFGILSVKYLVLDLDPDYRWAVVGHPSRNYGWVLARDKALPEARYRAILDGLARQGYEPARFVRVPQT